MVPVGCYQSKSMYNNNQVRGLCKFTEIIQTPNTDYKRNIYELQDRKLIYGRSLSCQGADYAVIK